MQAEWQRKKYPDNDHCHELVVLGMKSIAGRVNSRNSDGWHWATFDPRYGGGSVSYGDAPTLRQAKAIIDTFWSKVRAEIEAKPAKKKRAA